MINIKTFLTAHKILLVGFILAIVIVLAGRMALKPVNQRILDARQEIEKLSLERSNIMKEVEQIKGKEAELRDKEKRLTDYFLLKSKLGDLSNTSKFFKEITDYSKVKFNSLKPTKKERVSHYIKMEIALNIAGSYDSIYGYLKYLDELPYIISIKRLDFSKGQEKSYNNVTLIIETVGR